MRYLIIGAGGIGCYYGAKLQLAGHDVCYLARGEHLLAMQKHGLSVKHEDMVFHENVTAFDVQHVLDHEHCCQFDMILVTIKSGSTLSMLEQLEKWLNSAETPVLSLQNGVDNESLIASVVGTARTLGGLAVRIGGHIVAPGEVDVKGLAQVILGAWPNHQSEGIYSPEAIDACSQIFNQAGIPTSVSLDIRYELWRKLLINNGVNPLSALTGMDTRNLTSHPVFSKMVYKMMEEVASVASADSVTLSTCDVDEMFELICTFDAIKTSMLVDKEKGRPLELEGISGAIIHRAEKMNIEVPITALVNALLIDTLENVKVGSC